MLLTDFIKDSTKQLEALYPQKEARSIVMMLCQFILGTKNYTHIVEPKYEIEKSKQRVLDDAIVRLLKWEPVQYVLSATEFYGRKFRITPDVLIPRPETELLVEEVLKQVDRLRRMRSSYGKAARPVKVLDLCTGSGCIAWTLALELPGTKVTAVDISDEALTVARRQPLADEVKRLPNGVAPVFIKGDVLQPAPAGLAGEFDIVVANPPYVMESEKSGMRRNVLDYEPELAIFVPDEDPLKFYRGIAQWAETALVPGGAGIVEINDLLGPQTKQIFADAGYVKILGIPEYLEKPRIVTFAKPGLA